MRASKKKKIEITTPIKILSCINKVDFFFFQMLTLLIEYY
jgi:hypothetical protein